MKQRSFVNTGKLLMFMLRLGRFRILLWVGAISFFTIIVPVALTDLYPTQQERDVMAQTMENPAMTAMVGPGDLDNYTAGAMTAHQMLLLTAVVVALMNILLMNRHTRTDEEDGRLEMIRSLPVGNLANLNASIVMLVLINGILAIATGIGLSALDIASMDIAGSLLYGSILGAAGLFFAGVTALMAQITENARTVFGISLGLLLVAYMVRAAGDVGNAALSWLSPLGWVTKAEVYAGNHWWVLLLLLGGAALLFTLAGYSNAIRDYGAGFLPSRLGKKEASPALLHPVGLAFRLQRAGIIAWAAAMLLIGVSYGSVMGDLDSFFEGNQMIRQLLGSQDGHSFTKQFISILMVVMALVGTIPPLMALFKLSGEEKKNRLDHLLGRAVSRTQLLAGYILIAVINGFVMLSFAAVGLWLAASSVMEEPFAFGEIYGAGLAYYPAVLVMIGLAALLVGFAPKWNGLVWLYVFYSFIDLYFGDMFQFPEWAGKLSPYGYIPEMPAEEMEWIPAVVLTVVAAGLTATGFIRYKQRDVQGQ